MYLWLIMCICSQIIPLNILNITPQLINHVLSNFKWNGWFNGFVDKDCFWIFSTKFNNSSIVCCWTSNEVNGRLWIICAFVWHNLQANPFVYVNATYGLFGYLPWCPYYAFCATLPCWYWFVYTFIRVTNSLALLCCWIMVCTLILLQ